MNSSSTDVLLDTYLRTALSASNDLVATLCDPMENLGLSDDECRVLLLLWIADGAAESAIAARLHAAHIGPTLSRLEWRDLVLRVASTAGRSVWLTPRGRAMWTCCGIEEMGHRLDCLQHEIVALREVLCRAVGLLSGDDGARTVMAAA